MVRLNQRFQMFAVLRCAEILLKENTYHTSKVIMNVSKTKRAWIVLYFSSSFFFNSGAFSTMIENVRAIALSPTQITQMSVYEISLTEKDEPMLMTMRFCIVIVLCMCYVYEVFAQQCKEDEHAISGMMLRGHTFRTMRSSIAFECHQACYNDFRCHSFNYVISEELCEYFIIKYDEYHRTAIMHDYVIYQEPIKY